MAHTDSVTTWIGQLKNGDEQAAQQLWERYYVRLVRTARGKLRGASRRVADEEDVAIVAFNSFCRGVEEARFPQLKDRDNLWQVLLMLTERKALDQRRRAETIKRGGGDVRGESVFDRHGDCANSPGIDQVADREPTPAFAAQVTDELQRLLDALDEDDLQQIAVAKLDGYTNAEIARRLDVGLRSVERKLNLIRQIWREEQKS
jgi:DNA-directed RNA polymerase specialized sigma24 family protein